MVPMHVLTLIAAPPPSGSFLVLEPEEDAVAEGLSRVVPIRIGAIETMNLGAALESTRLARPTTHDLIMDMLTNLDATIDHTCIVDVKGDVFYAQLVLSQHGRLIPIDARPSDAISLAIRQGAPLGIDEKVLNRASYPFLFKTDKDNEEAMEDFREFLDGLSPEDFSNLPESSDFPDSPDEL